MKNESYDGKWRLSRYTKVITKNRAYDRKQCLQWKMRVTKERESYNERRGLWWRTGFIVQNRVHRVKPYSLWKYRVVMAFFFHCGFISGKTAYIMTNTGSIPHCVCRGNIWCTGKVRWYTMITVKKYHDCVKKHSRLVALLTWMAWG